MDVPFSGGGDVGGRCSGGGDQRHLLSEHHHKMYRKKAYYGPVYGGGVASSSFGIEVVVVTGRNKSRGDMGGGSVGRGGNGIGEWKGEEVEGEMDN